MKDKQIQIPFRRSIVAVLFIIWGIICLLFIDTEILGKILSSFLIVFGTVFFFYSFREVLQYRKTGEVKTRIDERVETNSLRASRRAFEFLCISIAVLIVLVGSKLINEQVFVALMGPVFAIGAVIYILSYHIYERGGDVE